MSATATACAGPPTAIHPASRQPSCTAVQDRDRIRNWCGWEDAALSAEPHGPATPYGDRPRAARVAFVRIASHYFAHAAWLEDGVLLRDARRLTGIPGVLLHGSHDLSSPPDTAWCLARAWPDARLSFVPDAGHKGGPPVRERIAAALDRFAR